MRPELENFRRVGRLTSFYAEMRSMHGYETNPRTRRLPDGTVLIGPYRRGHLAYTDRFRTFTDTDGKEVFHGFELVREREVPLWRRDYGGIGDPALYDFLKSVLRQFPTDRPFRRGATLHTEGELRYVNICHGDMSSFRNEEKILLGADELYFYIDKGGLIKTRKEVFL